MTMSVFSQGFAAGVVVRGVPLIQTHPGKVFWVGNSGGTLQRDEKTASNGNRGRFLDPYATIAYALSQCTAGMGDIIFVKPGHTLTIADATTLSMNVAGVAIIGLGVGSSRPTLTFTAATANIPITAANMVLQNFLFVANFADVASVFTATGTATPKDLTIDKCEFRDTSSILNFISVVTGNATANSLDGLNFTRNRISSLGTTAATTALKPLSATDRMTVTDNYGNWAVLNDTAAMVAGGANNLTNFDFGRNVLQRPNTSSTGGSFISSSSTACTGHCYDNYMYQLDNTAGIWIATGTKLGFSNNFSPITGAADKSGLINPAAV
jgi:hypothetical protein